MEATAKLLTRSHSSLLRSSPTIRPSIHSLSSVAEADSAPSLPSTSAAASPSDMDSDHDDHHRQLRKPKSRFPLASSSTTLLLAISFFTLFVFLGYFKACEITPSEKLLLALILIALALFFFGKHKPFFRRPISFLKQFYSGNSKKLLRFSRAHHPSKPVQWFIGGDSAGRWRDDDSTPHSRKSGRERVELFENGDCYEGEFHKGKCNGSGVYNYYLNGRYEGDWVDGKYDGYGIESWAKGSKYRGQYRQGLRHGYGVYRFYTGDTYSGEWSNGQSQGVGVQSCVDGSTYVGEFRCGVKHGLGCYHFRNGDRYTGEYFGDKIHGFGVYNFANGHRYEGSWHEGCKQGYGMYTFRNADTSSGDWDSGKLKSKLTPLSEPVIRAVEGARRAADKAINLRQVDDRVNKAILAANRAANAARVAAVKAVQSSIAGEPLDLDAKGNKCNFCFVV